jgi:hypothetical protein
VELLGIDFSGSVRSWLPNRSTSNVWVCRLKWDGGASPHVSELQPIQQLSGRGTPFQRLADILADRQFSAAAIDAPFSLPARHVPSEGWLKLLQMVDELPLQRGAPFPTGQALIDLALGLAPPERLKPLRATEKWWSERRINVRSTLWLKPRGGASFAAACMKLLARASFPRCWPWEALGEGLIVEAFPAAQLCSWKLPYQKYNRPEGALERKKIVSGMEARLDFGPFRWVAEESADALDAVISSFAAIAAHRNELAPPDAMTFDREGWIAVHP